MTYTSKGKRKQRRRIAPSHRPIKPRVLRCRYKQDKAREQFPQEAYQAYVTKEKRSATKYCEVERTTRTTYYHGFAV